MKWRDILGPMVPVAVVLLRPAVAALLGAVTGLLADVGLLDGQLSHAVAQALKLSGL